MNMPLTGMDISVIYLPVWKLLLDTLETQTHGQTIAMPTNAIGLYAIAPIIICFSLWHMRKINGFGNGKRRSTSIKAITLQFARMTRKQNKAFQ